MNITERDATSFKPKVAENVRRQSQVRTTIAKETPTEQFIEPRRFNLDEFEYERAGTDPGRIVIFNQEIFGNLKICNDATGKVEDHRLETRSGSRQDVIAIINTFQRMGFNIRANDVLSNGTVEDVLAKLDEGKSIGLKYAQLYRLLFEKFSETKSPWQKPTACSFSSSPMGWPGTNCTLGMVSCSAGKSGRNSSTATS
ncbi:hypothetical protein D910_00135 [Dendroctonus ponderosae]|uniref:Uncharacterized protein n=1 Tax=Dendroctonus ponderosae TaxID=77166 RepID=U4UZ71_DENPD|nr:hypothetical protein D910_00135 [Dendroctonus ponderosae]KAH1010822.1 hypothetical protein HUJ05_005065 [Dendroctonus ponderosae]